MKREKKREAVTSQGHHQHDDPYIQEDLTNRVRRVRQLLRPSLQEAIDAGKKAYFSYDKLIIDGRALWYDEGKKGTTTVRPKVLSCLDIKVNLDNRE